MKWLLGFIEDYAAHGHAAAGHGKERSSAVTQVCSVPLCIHRPGLIFTKNEALKAATGELRELLERFANGHSMNGIFDACHALIDDARRDEEFRDWFHRLDTFIRKVSAS